MDKSLFVLGAGASKDFCSMFPLGRELIKEVNYHFITEKLITNQSAQGPYLSALMNNIVRIFDDGKDEIPKRFEKIKNALWELLDDEWSELRNVSIIPPSIDSLVSKKISGNTFDQKDEYIIKCCISYLIMGFEQAKKEQKGFRYNWIYNLASKVSKFEANEIIENVSIVTFNYDRVFEHYFCNYLLHNDIFDETNKQEFLKNNVQHVYGSLGNLIEVEFGIANNLQTEKHYQHINLMRPKNSPLEVKKAIEFKKVHFLGFGYDDDNLAVLDLAQFKPESFSGTAYNFSQIQKRRIKDKIRGIELSNISCSEYINDIDL